MGLIFNPKTENEQPVYLLVYRDIDDKITFLELNPVSTRLINLLNEGQTGQQAAQQIARELQHTNADIVVDGARELIKDWLQRQVLI
ncbi:MAG: hypothetical protein Q9N32_06630 [Gammaproteobacteria bacterium]|nr:hypothetical protein [Gammaproteobacteria bacterium]